MLGGCRGLFSLYQLAGVLFAKPYLSAVGAGGEGEKESLRAAAKPGDVCPGGCVSVRPLGTASSCPLGETERREAGAKNSCPLPGLEFRQSGESPAAGWGGHGQCPELGTRDGGGILHVVLGPPSRPLAASFGVI